MSQESKRRFDLHQTLTDQIIAAIARVCAGTTTSYTRHRAGSDELPPPALFRLKSLPENEDGYSRRRQTLNDWHGLIESAGSIPGFAHAHCTGTEPVIACDQVVRDAGAHRALSLGSCRRERAKRASVGHDSKRLPRRRERGPQPRHSDAHRPPSLAMEGFISRCQRLFRRSTGRRLSSRRVLG